MNERLKKIPNGIHTLGLMSHETPLDNLRSVLENGVLSVMEQYKRFGKVNKGYGNDLHPILAAFNYISVYDPYCGYGTRAWHEQADRPVRKKIQEILRDYAVDLVKEAGLGSDDENKWKEFWARVKKEAIPASYSSRPDLWWGINRLTGFYSIEPHMEALADPRNKELLERLNDIYETGMSREGEGIPEDPVSYEDVWNGKSNQPKPINPLHYFVSDNSPVLLVNPALKRFPVSSCFGCESFIKDIIRPEDLVGLVIPKKCRTSELENSIAREFGVPLFISEQNLSEEAKRQKKGIFGIIAPKLCMEGQYRFEQIYPNKV